MKKFVAAILAGMIGLAGVTSVVAEADMNEFVEKFTAVWTFEAKYQFSLLPPEDRISDNGYCLDLIASLEPSILFFVYSLQEMPDKHGINLLFSFPDESKTTRELIGTYIQRTLMASVLLLYPSVKGQTPISAAKVTSTALSLASEAANANDAKYYAHQVVGDLTVFANFIPETGLFFIGLYEAEMEAVVPPPLK